MPAMVKRQGSIAVAGRYSDTRALGSDYEVLPTVCGCGMDGPVHLARGQDGNHYAVKSLQLPLLTDSSNFRKRHAIIREVSCTLQLDHPHLVRLENVYETPEEMHLVMEHMAGGELYSRVEKAAYPEEKAAGTCRQMLLAIAYLHNNNIAHRDIKLENFLYELPEGAQEGDRIKLTDLGLARFWDGKSPMRRLCGSATYIAPEVISNDYTTSADMWSFGILAYIMLTGQPLFVGKTSGKDAVYSDIKANAGKPDWCREFESLSADAKAFVQALIVEEPALRMNAAQALEHPWLRSCQSCKVASPIQNSIVQSMVRFSLASPLKRACFSMMAWTLGGEDIDELNEQFLAFDQHNRGTISPQEFRHVLEESSLADSREGQRLFHSLDVDGDGEISYSEFLAAAMYDHTRLHDDLLRKTFQRFDADRMGVITSKHLHAVLGDAFEGSDVKDLMCEVAPEHDGVIQFENFAAFLREAYEPTQSDETLLTEALPVGEPSHVLQTLTLDASCSQWLPSIAGVVAMCKGQHIIGDGKENEYLKYSLTLSSVVDCLAVASKHVPAGLHLRCATRKRKRTPESAACARAQRAKH